VTRSARLGTEAALVAAQIGRAPREPWRVGSRCRFGYPTTIVSPPRLSDGAPFPTLAWLCCPWLVEQVAGLESAGEIDRWSHRALEDPMFANALRTVDDELRTARAAEADGDDACAGVGVAGQRDPALVKCLHAHVALRLLGLSDPIGAEVLDTAGPGCDDERCARLGDPDAREAGR
jgi:hypothetical protein